MQTHLALIPHQAEGATIYQRPEDGYINATAMCQAANRNWADYRRLKTTAEFLDALSTDMGIPITELVQSVSGGEPRLQGTWVHPQVAINLAQWCSPAFAVRVSRWVSDWMSGRTPTGKSALPYHLQRYIENNESVPHGHFSVLAELSILLIAPLEAMGYRLPAKMVPDISSGRLFCDWLRKEKGLDTDKLPTYWHRYPDGRRVPAKAYPNDLLADFRAHVVDVWLPEHAGEYFRRRDSVALEYLPKLIAGPRKPRAA
ncbi:KilA-N domain-containing protein [Bosea sp. BK604]|uniref:KilA-N domain-containing protein n=1 Tax=Bosea sp. BK604 TaxID=2512180 RepID=UPI001046D44A|nr:KilA-N domain-containing protein [Bosea sp. BK604]TCR60921.1 KilA domain-containing protein [Bosea sp. BK604]